MEHSMSSPTTSEQHTDTPTPGGSGPRPDEQSQNPTGDQPTDQEAASEDEHDQRSALSLDLVFEILKNSRRREVLRYLKERRERVTLSELAEHVAAIENDTTVQALSSQQRKRVYVGLYQCHLPKLDDMDVVEFNQSRGHVDLGPNAAQLDKYLYMDQDEADERSWYRYYLGLAALSLVVLLGSAVTGAVGSTGTLLLSTGVVIAVAGLALVQARERGTLD